MKYRNRTDIVIAILEVTKGGTNKTRIMYKAFLTYFMLKEYLSILIENNLLEYIDENDEYKTTEKGSNFLKVYHLTKQLMP
jgi:predicted transcriptional regulator